MDVTEELVVIDFEMRIETAASIWLVRADRYLRMPRDERPRWPPSTGALTDGTWHPHRGVWRIVDSRGVRYRILPVDHAPGGHGVVTGDVVVDTSSRPRDDEGEPTPEPRRRPDQRRAPRPGCWQP